MPSGGELQKGRKPAVQLINSSKMSLKYHGENKETDINSSVLCKIGGSVIQWVRLVYFELPCYRKKNPAVSVISRSGSARCSSNNPKCIPRRKLTFSNSRVGTSEKGIINNLPNAVLAGVASFLIQKDTQERTTVNIQGMYVCIVKYPILLLKSKYIVMTT